MWHSGDCSSFVSCQSNTVGSSPTVGFFFRVCHAPGTLASYARTMPNPKRVRPMCANLCGKSIAKGNKYFCSNACRAASHNDAVVAAMRTNNLGERIALPRPIRRYLIAKLGERCQQCGWSERHPVTGSVPIEVEHKDGDWRNNAEENLTLLCPNCHSLTKTFRGLNRGKGRPGRPGLISGSEHVSARRRYFETSTFMMDPANGENGCGV